MKNRNLSFVVVFALYLLMTLIPCARAERGVTDNEIRIGQYGPQTGPVGRYSSWNEVLF